MKLASMWKDVSCVRLVSWVLVKVARLLSNSFYMTVRVHMAVELSSTWLVGAMNVCRNVVPTVLVRCLHPLVFVLLFSIV